MSYYDNQQWPAAGQATWDHQTPPARSGASSAVPREDSAAFSSQLEEVDRAMENLFKSGKAFAPPRREPMPMGAAGRGEFSQYDPRMAGGPRHLAGGEFSGDVRAFSGSNLQNFYATQRHQPSRASEAEQVMQAKRRMAAQRERELRNYHQEQQYNRSVLAELSTFGGKSDRAMSPGSGMSEEERRELIARQRSALYGENSGFSETGNFDESGAPRPGTQGSGNVSTGRGHSPLAFENNGEQGSAAAPGQQQQPRSRANSTSSPSSNPTNFALFDNAAQQSSRTSTSSPGGSPPRQGGKATPNAAVAPIGTRPSSNQQAPNPALNKRSTTPLPSPLSYGYAAGEDGNGNNSTNNTATSATSNSSGTQEVGLGWGSKSAVWGKNSLGVQASVWG